MMLTPTEAVIYRLIRDCGVAAVLTNATFTYEQRNLSVKGKITALKKHFPHLLDSIDSKPQMRFHKERSDL